jgi:hypothetical protein
MPLLAIPARDISSGLRNGPRVSAQHLLCMSLRSSCKYADIMLFSKLLKRKLGLQRLFDLLVVVDRHVEKVTQHLIIAMATHSKTIQK